MGNRLKRCRGRQAGRSRGRLLKESVNRRAHGSLDQGGGGKDGEKWLDIKEIFEDRVGYTFKVVRKGSHSIIILT